MKYQLMNGVWELTMACNMRCKHCGSSCNTRHEDELSLEEAYMVCDQLGAMNMAAITISGGELTTRDDWHLIAKRLTDNGIYTSMITNGWLLNDDLIQKAKDAGIKNIAISIDGLRDTHDFIRRKGSFDKDMDNLKRIKEYGIPCSVITTIHEQNLPELEDMYTYFNKIGITLWQLQIALPMGNFTHHADLYLKKEHISDIISFAYAKKDGPILMCLGDSVGYYTKKEQSLKKEFYGEDVFWKGCPAGKYSIGILCNGDIVGCTSVRNPEFIEGNVRETPIADIWNSDKHFLWNRNLKKSDLKGFCSECIYGESCLGGCSNSRYCFNDDILCANEYCAYHQDMKEYKEAVDACEEEEELKEFAFSCINDKHYQVALFAVNKLLLMKKEDILYLQWYAFIQFQIKNYDTCIKANERILAIENNHSAAKKGLGLALYMSGKKEEGIRTVEESLANGIADNYADLYALYQAEKRFDDAERIQKEAMERFSVDISKK